MLPVLCTDGPGLGTRLDEREVSDVKVSFKSPNENSELQESVEKFFNFVFSSTVPQCDSSGKYTYGKQESLSKLNDKDQIASDFATESHLHLGRNLFSEILNNVTKLGSSSTQSDYLNGGLVGF